MPRTAAGKAISSQNAYKHGVYSQQLRLRPDEQAPFETFRRGLLADLKPNGALQTEIFTRLLRTLWTLRRLDAREDAVFLETGSPLVAQASACGIKEFENTLRYRRFLSKEQRELTAELRTLQTEAATRSLGPDYAALANFSPLVAVRPLVDLENARCAARNHGRPLIRFARPSAERDDLPERPPQAA